MQHGLVDNDLRTGGIGIILVLSENKNLVIDKVSLLRTKYGFCVSYSGALCAVPSEKPS